MSESVVICTHVKADGVSCGSPAVAGTGLCYHHSAARTALKAQSNSAPGNGGFAPIPFVFPDGPASMQINFFLLLQAFNEGRIDQRTCNCFLSLLRSMAKNMGKLGPEDRAQEGRDQDPENRAQEGGNRGSGNSEPRSQNRDLGHPHPPLKPEACFLNSVAAAGRSEGSGVLSGALGLIL